MTTGSVGKDREMSRTSTRLVGIAIDCAATEPVVRFYEQLLGFEVVERSPSWAQLRDPVTGVHLNVQQEPDYVGPTWPDRPGEQAKMLHLEIEVDDLDAAVAAAEAAGGSEAPWQPPDRDQARLRIMFDPAGHPLCLFLPGE